MDNHDIQKRIIQLPLVDKKLIRRSLVGVRPYRKTGIRLQRQVREDKIVFHNYGHGGAGISLSPATALQTAQLIQKQKEEVQEVAVLGCGIVGLTSALELSARGYKVKIYSQFIPSSSEKDNSKMITSQVAPGEWFPYFHNFQNEQEYSLRSDRAYKIYKYWFYQDKLKGISECTAYQQQSEEEFKKMLPQSVGIEYKRVKGYFSKNSSKYKELIEFRTYKIHLTQLLQSLINVCTEKGVEFEEYRMQTFQNVKMLKQKYIVNCLGLGSKRVFGDTEMFGMKGHILQLQNPLNLKDIICLKDRDANCVQFYCHHDKVLIGLTTQRVQEEDKTPNQKTIQNILENAIRLKKQYESPNSKL